MYDQQWQGCPAAAPDQQQEGGELPLEAVAGCYLAALHSCLLGELRLEPLVVGLSDGYELCRQVILAVGFRACWGNSVAGGGCLWRWVQAGEPASIQRLGRSPAALARCSHALPFKPPLLRAG